MNNDQPGKGPRDARHVDPNPLSSIRLIGFHLGKIKCLKKLPNAHPDVRRISELRMKFQQTVYYGHLFLQHFFMANQSKVSSLLHESRFSIHIAVQTFHHSFAIVTESITILTDLLFTYNRLWVGFRD